jgi:hypothetical protein
MMFIVLFLAFFNFALVSANFNTLITRFSADPSPFVVGDRLYVTATHDDVNMTSFSMHDYNVFSTNDAVNWQDDGICFSPTSNTTWARNAWAQQVIYVSSLNKYVMYFPGFGVSGSVGVAISNLPFGPYVDYAMGPIAPGEDPTIFIDDDGTPILCSSISEPYNMPSCGVLNNDYKSWKVNQTQVFIEGLQPGNYFEAPWLFKRGNTYFLSFMEDYEFSSTIGSPNGWSLGYATNNSSNPLGNYTYQGALMWANPRNCDNAAHCNDSEGFVGGNAHHGFALDWPTGSGQSWLLYHTRNLAVDKTQVTFSQRNVALDRVYFSSDGSKIITPVTSTPNWVRQLKYVNPYVTQSAVLMGPKTSLFLGSQPGDQVDPLGGFRRFLWNITDGSYLSIQGVDFGVVGTGATTFTVRVASVIEGGSIEARLDSFDGFLVATIAVPNTGGVNAFSNVSTSSIMGASGCHDLYLVFRGSVIPPLNLFNMMSWRFDGSVASESIPPPVKVQVGIKSRASGLFVSAPLDGTLGLVANSGGIGELNRFILYDNYDGSWSIQAVNGLFVSAVLADDILTASSADRNASGSRWILSGTPDEAYALISSSNGRLIQTDKEFNLIASGQDAVQDGVTVLFDFVEL